MPPELNLAGRPHDERSAAVFPGEDGGSGATNAHLMHGFPHCSPPRYVLHPEKGEVMSWGDVDIGDNGVVGWKRTGLLPLIPN